ncbi:hypothetical protein [Streptomyces sp. YGL11-2]|uniref:hypothetical protein n=1 Tax=Streptomyces sp. YGL11-2 TaxID=3414028 RepID=UPI003CE8DCA9
MAFCTVVVVVAGLLYARSGSQGPPAAPAEQTRNQTPFDRALANLATARVLRYTETVATGITRRDITVTPSGALFGSTGEDGTGLEQDVLRIGGSTYTREKNDRPYENPDGGQQTPDAPGAWSVADSGNAQPLGPVLDRFLPPAELAVQLWDAVDELKTLPDPNDPRLRAGNVNGVPALRADTAAGRLFVSRDKPYRVLRLEPYGLSGRPGDRPTHPHTGGSPSAVPRVTTGPLEKGDSLGMDLSPISGDLADQAYNALETDTRQLADVVDQGADVTLTTSDSRVSCDTGACTVHERFTGELTSGTGTRLSGGRITAVMRTTVTIGGQDAGGCTSPPGTFTLTGNTVSGRLSCSDPEAGSVLAALNPACKAPADAGPRAHGGRPDSCRFRAVADPVVDITVLAVGDADKLVRQVQQESRDGQCPNGRHSPDPVDDSSDAPRTFPNLFPADTPDSAEPIPPRTALSQAGSYRYVVREDGELAIGKRTVGEVGLARSGPVLAAGEFRTEGGKVERLDNRSGHYRPYGVHAEQAALAAFNRKGLHADGKYIAAWGRPGC